MRIFSVGHGARDIIDFLATLAAVPIELVVDVRSFPGSRRHPQFGKEALHKTLTDCDVEYLWLPSLGGRRKLTRDPSPNPSWKVEAFRAYADYMDTDEFAAGIEELVRRANKKRTVFMCAETHYSQCHRRLISDKLWSMDHEVIHLISPTRQEPHAPTPFLRVDRERLRYDR
jgi:uncharacterized protein (DUF488 family)